MVTATLVCSFALMHGLNGLGRLRVSAQGERLGLDVHEHGATAYPEFEPIAADTLDKPAAPRPAPSSLPRARIVR